MTQIHWLNPVSDSFTNASDWSGGVVPTYGNDAILDAPGATPYTVTVNTDCGVDSIQTASTATLSIQGYSFFKARYGTGSGVNAGTIAISAHGLFLADGTVDNTGLITNASEIRINRSLTLTGGGAVIMGAGSRFGTNGGSAILLNVDNTISGAGLLGRYLTSLVNDAKGVIDGDMNLSSYGGRYLVVEGPITNFGTIEATNGGGVFLSFPLDNKGLVLNDASRIFVQNSINNSSGVISATHGGQIILSEGTISGGVLTTSNGGIIGTNKLSFQTDELDGTTSAVSNEGVFTIWENTDLTVLGEIRNTGQITVGASAQLIVGGSAVTLTGGGAITLYGAYHGGSIHMRATSSLTNFDNIITGAGSITGGRLMTNEAAGVIDANGSGGLVLDTGPGAIANSGLIEATGPGGLIIRGGVDGSGGGVILAGVGSHVDLQGADLIGGTLKSTGSGKFVTFAGANALDGTVSAVNNQASIIIAGGTALTLTGAIDNTDRFIVNGGAAGGSLTVGTAGATLSGAGHIYMGAGADNAITGANSAAMLTNVDNTISGAGQIGAGSMTLINDARGAFVGSLATALTIDTGANTIINAGLILSRGTGGVTVQSAVANSGLLEANGGVLTVNGAVSGTGAGVITGGTLDFASSYSQKVVFTGATGVLELAQSQTYAGTVFGFSKTGGTSLDLRDIGFVSSSEATFSGTASSGVLAVTDGAHTAHITLRGDYRASTFTASSDGHGGTTVVDPAAASTTAAHRFVAAAASMAGVAGAAIHTGEAWSVREPILVRPRSMTA